MKSMTNKFTNKILSPPSMGAKPEYVKDIVGLPIWTDGMVCVSEWELSFKERLLALIFGRIWLSILSGSTQPPVNIVVTRKFLREGK